MNTVTFLKEPLDSPNRNARISKMSNGNYHVVNANMPYMGSINEVWTEAKLNKKLSNKEIKCY
jgi:hypothetical protein